ncbi:MAG: ROK family protein [Lentisphaerota bacterium]
MEIYIGLDIGGTKIMVASTDGNGKELKRTKVDTPKSFNEGLNLINHLIQEIAKGKKILGIGAAIGGPLDSEKGIVSPLHQENWRNVPLKEIMEKEWKAPFFVDVDTNVAALGEYNLGNYKEKYFLYITLSTGMGGGFLLNGKIYQGLSHPEFAHQCINYRCSHPERVICECGGGSCLEALVSGNGIRRVYKKNAEKLCQHEWKEVAYNLGMGLRNIATILSPELVVFGGGVSLGGGNLLLEQANECMLTGLKLVPPPKLKLSCLGYDTALRGACFIATGKHLSK